MVEVANVGLAKIFTGGSIVGIVDSVRIKMEAVGNVKGDGDRANVGDCPNEIIFIKGCDVMHSSDLGADVVPSHLLLRAAFSILCGILVGVLGNNAANVVNVLHCRAGPSAPASIVSEMATGAVDELLLSQTGPLRTIKNFRDAVMGLDCSCRRKRPAGSASTLRFDWSYDTLGSPIMELWKLEAVVNGNWARRSMRWIAISGLHQVQIFKFRKGQVAEGSVHFHLVTRQPLVMGVVVTID
mmetsp:Transcript_11431/g.26917  ORF Transcript_11431/g.26917 Transcript_11431/m.26917 type:complete len:241 (+) Transcript_11431:1559-2281(+)